LIPIGEKMPGNSKSFTGTTPVQAKLLLPLKRSEWCLRSIRLLWENLPEIHYHIYFLHVMDRRDPHEERCIHRDLQATALEYFPDNVFTILVLQGKTVATIVHTARKTGASLIVVPFTTKLTPFCRRSNRTISELVGTCPFPLLFLPDPEQSGSHFPIRKIDFHLLSRFVSNESLAVACRLLRLLDVDLRVVTSRAAMRKKGIKQWIHYNLERYLDSESRDRVTVALPDDTSGGSLYEQVHNTDPDLVILDNPSGIALSSLWKRQNIYEAVRFLRRPVLTIRTFNPAAILEQKYRRVFERLSDYDLAKSDSSIGSMNSVDLEKNISKPELLFGVYSGYGIRKALKEYGLLDELSRMGFPEIRIDVSAQDLYQQRLRIFPTDKRDSKPMVDLVLRQQTDPYLHQPLHTFPTSLKPFLVIEWLLLQDPERKYHSGVIPLPGQDHPGLGVGWKVLFILKLMAERLGAAGLYNSPQYYHTARFFHRFFHYVSPEMEGSLLALDRDTYPLHTGVVSWAVLHGLVQLVRNNQSTPFQWQGSSQILPFAPQLKHYFSSREYHYEVRNSLNAHGYKLDREKLKQLQQTGNLYNMPGDGYHSNHREDQQ
jgi:hypothetical protein